MLIIFVSHPGSVSSQEAVTSVSETPHAVTVFENRARVKRLRALTLSAGIHQEVFQRLPAELNPNSLRGMAIGADAGNVLILAVQLKEEFPVQAGKDQAALLRSRLNQVEDQILGVKANIRRNELHGRLLKRYAEILRVVVSSPPSAQGQPQWSLQDVEPIQQWLLSGEVEIAGQVDRLMREKEQLIRQRDDLRSDLEKYRSDSLRRYWTATVTCQSLEDTTFDLELSYDVPSAKWEAVHEARLDEDRGIVTWKQGARVTQSTGEDWSKVDLTLSTLQSSLGLSAGRLIPVEVSLEDREEPLEASRSLRDSDLPDSIQLDGVVGGLSDNRALFSGWSASEVKTGYGGVVSFQIQSPADVPSDGSPHAIHILSWEVTAELAFEAIPALGQGVYRRARLIQPGPGLLLKGEVQCFRSGTFVGLGEVETIAPGQKFFQYFGLDGRLKLHAQELTEVQTPSRSAFSRHRYEKKSLYAVSSFLDQPAEVELVSRIPISMVEELTIELGPQSDPKPQISRDGICRWKLKVMKNERQQVIFQWIAEADRGSEDLLDLLR